MKYVKENRLGSGGGGEVWRAWDPELRRWVALKLLRSDDPEMAERFLREAQAAGKIEHPNIACVYDAGTFEDRPYIAIQFVDGPTLASHPRRDVRRLVEIVRDAALGVQAAHERGVIHRDLKPANIMVDEPTGRAIVLDFGLAKQIDAAVSQTGTVLGTPAYMPPEQALGLVKAVDARSDVYSLGATLYELLSNRAPFRGSNAYEILRRVVEEDPPPLPPRVDADLATVVTKCLEKEASRRYPTAGALANELTRWLAGEAIAAHPPSVFYRARKSLARRKAIAGIVAISLAAASTTVALLIRERNARAQKEAELVARRVQQQSEFERRERARPHLESGRRFLDQIPFARDLVDPLARRAISDFEKAGDDPEAWLGLGRAWALLGDRGRARECFTKALPLRAAYFERGRLDGNEEDLAQAGARGLIAYRRGDFAAAEPDLARHVEEQPWDLEALEWHVLCLLKLGRKDEHVRQAERLRRLRELLKRDP